VQHPPKIYELRALHPFEDVGSLTDSYLARRMDSDIFFGDRETIVDQPSRHLETVHVRVAFHRGTEGKMPGLDPGSFDTDTEG
jgi:hypothetical protein